MRVYIAEDYLLKQITASLIYPEGETGKRFWKRIYEEAAKKFGTTNIPVNTFNKVWIVPEKAVVYENAKAGTAYVVEAKLKVMLEQDYLALSHSVIARSEATKQSFNDVNSLGSQIVREIVIPELTKEVNENKNFAQLRQVYNSLILATWYKKKIKDSILAQVYADKKKIVGVGYENSVIARPSSSVIARSEATKQSFSTNDVEAIYKRYLQAFKKGVYNYIKEEPDPMTQETIPRKYFSGGTTFDKAAMASALSFTTDAAIVSQPLDQAQVVDVEIDQAMRAQAPPIKISDEALPIISVLVARIFNGETSYKDLVNYFGGPMIQPFVRQLLSEITPIYSKIMPVRIRSRFYGSNYMGKIALEILRKNVTSDVYEDKTQFEDALKRSVMDVIDFIGSDKFTLDELQRRLNAVDRLLKLNYFRFNDFDIKRIQNQYEQLGGVINTILISNKGYLIHSSPFIPFDEKEGFMIYKIDEESSSVDRSGQSNKEITVYDVSPVRKPTDNILRSPFGLSPWEGNFVIVFKDALDSIQGDRLLSLKGKNRPQLNTQMDTIVEMLMKKGEEKELQDGRPRPSTFRDLIIEHELVHKSQQRRLRTLPSGGNFWTFNLEELRSEVTSFIRNDNPWYALALLVASAKVLDSDHFWWLSNEFTRDEKEVFPETEKTRAALAELRQLYTDENKEDITVRLRRSLFTPESTVQNVISNTTVEKLRKRGEQILDMLPIIKDTNVVKAEIMRGLGISLNPPAWAQLFDDYNVSVEDLNLQDQIYTNKPHYKITITFLSGQKQTLQLAVKLEDHNISRFDVFVRNKGKLNYDEKLKLFDYVFWAINAFRKIKTIDITYKRAEEFFNFKQIFDDRNVYNLYVPKGNQIKFKAEIPDDYVPRLNDMRGLAVRAEEFDQPGTMTLAPGMINGNEVKANQAMLVASEHEAVNISIEGDLKQHEELANRIGRIVNYVLDNNKMPEGEDVSSSGRSIIFFLPEKEQFTMYGRTFKFIRLIGSTDNGERPKALAYAPGTTARIKPSTYYLQIQEKNGEEFITYQPSEPDPQGGMLLKFAKWGYKLMTSIFKAGIPTALPIGYGVFTDMKFNGEETGFIILAEEENPSLPRMATMFSQQLRKGLTRTYYDDLGKAVFAAGNLLGRLHRAGFTHSSPHLDQFTYRENSESRVYDFEAAYDVRDGISKDEFIYRVLVDFMGFYTSVDKKVRINNMPMDSVLKSEEARKVYENILNGYFSQEELGNIKGGKNPKALMGIFSQYLSREQTSGKNLANVIETIIGKNTILAELVRVAGEIYDRNRAMTADRAMKVVKNNKTGGIDLTPANMNLQTKMAPPQAGAKGIQFHIDPAMLQQLQNAPGFVPVIISVKPLGDLQGFLGIVNQTQ